MATKKHTLEEMSQKNPFKIPEGYFENFTEDMMFRLPEKEKQEAKTISMWERIKPWAYMAAMFIGIALMVKIFVISPGENGPEGILAEENNSVPVSEIDEFYSYYEDQYANNLYRQTFYLEEFPSDVDIE